MQNDIFSMVGKNVVFTGGCGNLGKVMVKALLDYGANVAVPNRSDKFDASYDAYKAAGKLVVIPTDLKKTEDTRKAFLKAEEIFGKIKADFYAGCCDDEETKVAIKEIKDKNPQLTFDIGI